MAKASKLSKALSGVKNKGKRSKASIEADKKIKALKPGTRKSASGKKYTENRANRSDQDLRKKFAKGGSASGENGASLGNENYVVGITLMTKLKGVNTRNWSQGMRAYNISEDEAKNYTKKFAFKTLGFPEFKEKEVHGFMWPLTFTWNPQTHGGSEAMEWLFVFPKSIDGGTAREQALNYCKANQKELKKLPKKDHSDLEFAKGGTTAKVKITKEEKALLMIASMYLNAYRTGHMKQGTVGYTDVTNIIDKFGIDPTDFGNINMAILYLTNYSDTMSGKEKENLKKQITDLSQMANKYGASNTGEKFRAKNGVDYYAAPDPINTGSFVVEARYQHNPPVQVSEESFATLEDANGAAKAFRDGVDKEGKFEHGGLTVIDFSVDKSRIINFDKLPKKVQELIEKAQKIESRGFQALLGYQGRQIVFEANGYWHDDHFHLQGIGGKVDGEHIVWNGGETTVTKYGAGGAVETLHNGRYLKLEILPNGNLKISLTEEGADWIKENGNIDYENFSELFEDIQANSELMYFPDAANAEIGLSNSPVITDGYFYEDFVVLQNHEDSRLWYYDDYQIRSPFDVLVLANSVEFQAAPKDEEQKFFFGGPAKSNLNDVLKNVADHQLTNHEPLTVSSTEFEHSGYKNLVRNGYIGATPAGTDYKLSLTAKGYQFYQGGQKFEKGGTTALDIIDMPASFEEFAQGGVLWSKKFKLDIFISPENAHQVSEGTVLAFIVDENGKYLASISKMDNATYPHFDKYGSLMADSPELARYLGMLFQSYLYWMERYGDKDAGNSTIAKQIREILAKHNINLDDDSRDKLFAEGGLAHDKRTSMQTFLNSVGIERPDQFGDKNRKWMQSLFEGKTNQAGRPEVYCNYFFNGNRLYVVGQLHTLEFNIDDFQSLESWKPTNESLLMFDNGGIANAVVNAAPIIAVEKASLFSEHRKPFKAGLLEGKFLDNGDYLVQSLGFYPVWYWNAKEQKWYGNKDHINNVEMEHYSLSRPDHNAVILSLGELINVMKQESDKYDLGGLIVQDLLSPINNLGVAHS